MFLSLSFKFSLKPLNYFSFLEKLHIDPGLFNFQIEFQFNKIFQKQPLPFVAFVEDNLCYVLVYVIILQA